MNEADWTPERHLALPLLVVVPTAFLSLADSLYHNLHEWFFQHSPYGYVMLPFGSPLIIALLCAIAVWYAIPIGRDGLLALGVGYAFAWFVLFHFRGPLYWHGLFDLADRNPWPAYAWIPISIVLGIVLYCVTPSRPSRERVTLMFVALGIVALLYGWAQALLRDDVYSYYPLTRHLALTTVIAVVVVVALVVTKWFPELWEES